MSGRYQQGFDYFPTGFSAAQITALLQAEGWYAISITPQPHSIVSPGRFGYGRRLQYSFSGFANGPNGYLFPLGYHNSAGGWVSAGLNVSATSGPPTLFVFDAVNDIYLASVTFGVNGIVYAWRGAPLSGTLLGQSDPGAFRMGVDFDAEVFFKIGTTTGEVEVRIDTDAVLTLTNINTQPGANAYFDSHGFGFAGGPANITISFLIDDYRVYDTAGVINNTWLGTMRVQTSLPNGNGATTDFTRSNTGIPNWQNIINENVDDTLYLFDNNPTDFNLSTIAPLVNSPAVAWVGVLSFLRQDDATQITAKNRLVSGGVTQDGAAFLTTQSYSGDLDIYETDPATGVQFTGSAVNALQIGPYYVSHA